MQRFWGFGARPYWGPRTALAGLILCLAGVALVARAAFPKSTGAFVNDFANILDESSRASLNQLLTDVERKTTAQIVFVSVPSLDGMHEDEYANKLFKEWGIGKQKEDNGVLVLVAPNERAMRIEVGYGLEGVLPDGLAGEIIRNQFTPRFKAGDYPGGIRAGVARIAEVVEKNHVLTAEERQRIDNPPIEQGPIWILIPFIGIFVAIGGFMFGLGVRTKIILSLIIGFMFGGVPFLIAFAIVPAIASATLGPLGLAMAVVGYRKGGTMKWRNSSGTKGTGWTMGGGGSSGGSSGSSSGSSWSSGGGSSSSGSSFGGGSSGGGGASGRW